MKTYDIPERWQPKIDAYVRAHATGPHRDLGAINFCQHVRLRFLDDSHATFHHAFHLAAPEFDELAVFTEHCLHHIFPFHGTKVELFDADGGDFDG